MMNQPCMRPAGGLNGGRDSSHDRFDNPEPTLRRRFQQRRRRLLVDGNAQDLRPAGPPALPSPSKPQAAAATDESGGNWDERSSERERRMARFGQRDDAAEKRLFGERDHAKSNAAAVAPVLPA